MAANQNENPPLTDESRKKAAEIVGQFDRDLKEIAATIARKGETEAIIVPHIKQAHQNLKHAGLKSKGKTKFYLRPDFWVGFGALLFGFVPTVSTALSPVL